MNKFKHRVQRVFVPLLILISFSNLAQANLVSTVTVDFDGGDYHFFDQFGNPLMVSNVVLPGSVIQTLQGNQSYVEEGIRHQAIGIADGGFINNHVHGHSVGTFPNFDRKSQMLEDAGGAQFLLHTGGAFSFLTWEDEFVSTDIVVRGYQSGGGTFDVTLDQATYGSASENPDFLALDARFANVVLVEYWHSVGGRGIAVPGIHEILLDDVVFSAPVPLPAALPMFVTALLGVVGMARRRTRPLIVNKIASS